MRVEATQRLWNARDSRTRAQAASIERAQFIQVGESDVTKLGDVQTAAALGLFLTVISVGVTLLARRFTAQKRGLTNMFRPHTRGRAPRRQRARMKEVRLVGVRKTFATGDREQEVQAVRGVDLTVEPGEFFILLGSSGSGKTTLLRCIAGLEQPTAGEIHIGDAAVYTPQRTIPA